MEKIKARISRLTTKQKKGLIIAAIAAGGFLAVFIPIMVIMNNPANQPIPLAITGSVSYVNKSFSFGNNSRAVSFELSIPAGKQVNITFTNNNGTRLRVGVSRTQTQSQCGFSRDSCLSIVSTLLPVLPGTLPEKYSTIFTALVDTKLCLFAQGYSFGNPAIRWSDTGGFIEVQDTGMYNATALAQNENAINNINITTADTTEYYREFGVSTTGYYLINSSASATQGSNPDTLVQVLLKDTGPASDVPSSSSYRISGAAREIARLDHTGGAPSNHYTVIYLETGKTYILRYTQHGFVNYVRWELIKSVQGSVGSSGMTLDFTASPTTTTIYRPSTTMAVMFVDFGTALRYNTLYDINFSGDPYPGRLGAGVFNVDNGWQITYENTGDYLINGHHGRLLLLEDTCEPLSKDGQQLARSHGYIRMFQSTTPWGNYSLSPMWGSGTINQELNVQHQLIAVWFTGASGLPLPTNVILSVSEHPGGVSSFPGISAGDLYNSTLTFRNDGAEGANGAGLYKLSGHRDSEIQIQFPQMDMLDNHLLTFNFITLKSTRGAYYFNTSTASGQTYFNFANVSRTWGGSNPDWDTPIVFEVGLMEDPVYVIIAGSVSTSVISNMTTFTMTYKFEPFLSINSRFTVSRDNQLQIFKAIALPASGLIQSYVDYGSCCNLATGLVWILPSCSCLPIGSGTTWSYSGLNPTAGAWPGSPVAYVVWRRYDLPGASGQLDGTIMRINIWSGAPVDWLAWGCFIGAAAGLAVVGLMFWKHKIIRVR